MDATPVLVPTVHRVSAYAQPFTAHGDECFKGLPGVPPAVVDPPQEDGPAARQFLQGLVDYAASETFDPKVELDDRFALAVEAAK